MTTTNYIGKPQNRVDGKAKVTGEAKYAAEHNVPDIVHGVVVSSAIARGKIKDLDESEALKIPGVLKVFSHKNVPGLAWFNMKYKDQDAPKGDHFRPLHTSEIQFSLQPIALVVAKTFEAARYASSLIKIDYETSEFETELESNLDKAFKPGNEKSGFKKPKSRGNFKKAFSKAPVKIEEEYFHGAEHHNPMEMHASTVIYEKGDKLTVYDKTQGVFNSQSYITGVFGLSKKKVQVLAPFVGGAFGSGLRPQYQLFMAVLAALELKRSAKVVLTRQQMFSFGHRPVTMQKVAVGATHDGGFEAIKHEAFSETSQFENYVEIIVNWSGMLYKCDNVALDYKLVKLDMYTPLDMRAPGAATGVTAIECAIDELSYKLGIDPLELRFKNYTDKDPMTNKKFSSKALNLCYEQGAEKFGWAKRSLQPRSMKEGNNLVGWGMATGMWDAMFVPSRAKAVLSPDGKLIVSSGTADIGTGTYTIMTQIAAETLGLPLDDVTFKLGDTSLPLAYLEGGSATAASVGTAVKYTCDNIKEKVFKLAKKIKGSPIEDADLEDVTFADGYITLNADTSKSVSIIDALKENDGEDLKDTSTALPNMLKQMPYARNTHSAVFVEVKVDEELGIISVTRVVSAIAAGRIINPKTARSQILGGVVWGISMALQEDSFMDHNFGRFMNHNYAEYHVPVLADINDIEVIFVEEKDENVNPLGVKGVGEIGLVGVAAAVANAIYHATGKRVRDLPITLDKLL